MKLIFYIFFFFIFLTSCSRWNLIEGNYDPKTIVPRGLFLINNSDIYLGARQGLFLLSAEDKFNRIDIPAPQTNVMRCLVEINSTLFAGFEGVGLFRSLDNGVSWERISEKELGDKIWGLFTYDSTIIVTTWPRNIYSSTDNGNTWTNISNGMPEGGMGVCIGHSQGMILKDTFLFCSVFNEGVFRMGLNEKKWRPVREGLPNYFKTRGIASMGKIILCGTEDGVYKSNDNGITWQSFNDGIKNVMVISFYVNENKIYATSNEGKVYRYMNENWKLINKGLHAKDVVYDIKNKNNKLFISVDGQEENPSGVYFLKIKK